MIQKHQRRCYASPRIHQGSLHRHQGGLSIARLLRQNSLSCLLRKRFQVIRIPVPKARGRVHPRPKTQRREAQYSMAVGHNLPTHGKRMAHSYVVIDTFSTAAMRRQPRGRLLSHSDRGIQCCSAAVREVSLSTLPILVRSMSRKGTTGIMSVQSLSARRLRVSLRNSPAICLVKVRMAVFECVETYYNRIRIQSRSAFRPPAVVHRREA